MKKIDMLRALKETVEKNRQIREERELNSLTDYELIKLYNELKTVNEIRNKIADKEKFEQMNKRNMKVEDIEYNIVKAQRRIRIGTALKAVNYVLVIGSLGTAIISSKENIPSGICLVGLGVVINTVLLARRVFGTTVGTESYDFDYTPKIESDIEYMKAIIQNYVDYCAEHIDDDAIIVEDFLKETAYLDEELNQSELSRKTEITL